MLFFGDTLGEAGFFRGGTRSFSAQCEDVDSLVGILR